MSREYGKRVVKLTKSDHERLLQHSSSSFRNYQGALEVKDDDLEQKIIEWPVNAPKKENKTQENAEAQLEAEHYLARAKLMQLEQEDEVKRANKIILATKCQAIRDAQMAERERLLKELKEEDERLDRMMEEERLRGLKMQAKKKEQTQIRRSKYVRTLVHQIEENETKKIEEHLKELNEGRKLRDLHKKLSLEEEEKKKKQIETQLKIRKELNKMNEAIKHRHQIDSAEEKLVNLRIQQYMKEKAAREAEREEKRRRAKMAQEMEIARLRACQVRQQEVQAREEEEAVEREQEKVARAWRAKELETAKKRLKMEKELREERAKQAEEKRKLREIELEKEANDVKILLSRIDEDKYIQQEEKIKHEQEMLKYRSSLQKQIKEKERRLEILRQQKQKEASEDMQRQLNRKSDLEGILNMKLKELRSHKVPDKYIIGVEKQLRFK